MSKDAIRERIDQHIAGFKVGDQINALIYPGTEYEGELIKIDGHIGEMKTEHGTFIVILTIAKKVSGQY